MSVSPPPVAGPPVPRVCGRCRETSSGDPTAVIGPMPGWWACAACTELLLGGGAMKTPAWARRG